MRLVGYLRVSGSGQLDGWGMDRQEQVIRAQARRGGHRIVGWERDEGRSGTIEAVDREGLAAAIEWTPRRADAVAIADLDRLARSLTVQEAALAVVWQRGGDVWLAATGDVVPRDDPDDPSRTLIRQVMGAVIQYDRSSIVKRLRQGRAAKRAAGRHAVGDYPFGTRGAGQGRDRDATVDPEEAVTVARILQLRGELDEDGQPTSYRTIAATLDREQRRPRRASRWSAMAVRRVVQREEARTTAG